MTNSISKSIASAESISDNFWPDHAEQLKVTLDRLSLERVLSGETVINSETLEYLNVFAGMSDHSKSGIVATLKQER